MHPERSGEDYDAESEQTPEYRAPASECADDASDDRGGDSGDSVYGADERHCNCQIITFIFICSDASGEYYGTGSCQALE